MNIFQETREMIIEILVDFIAEEKEKISFEKIAVEVPKDKNFGELSTNAALVLSKPLGYSPISLAEKLKKVLIKKSVIKTVNIAKPGFLNMTLSNDIWNKVLKSSIQLSLNYGKENFGKGKKINLEYISANPTGPLHVGHTRGAVFGDVLANLLSFAGYNLTREYYINDGGQQIDSLARSLYLRLLELKGEKVSFDDNLYPGDYLIDLAKKLKSEFEDQLNLKNESESISFIKTFAVDEMMKIIKNDLSSMKITMDNFFSEKSLYTSGKIEKAIDRLEEKGLIYQGFLEKPKGKIIEDWESREQTLFKSTEYGDDIDRPIKKSDGGWTYFAPDIAYHFDKIERGYKIIIDIFGADHSGYVKRMNAAVSALSDGKVEFSIKLCQLVNLFKDGKPYKMSKRLGSYITIKDVIDEVGADSVRFMMLTRRNDAHIDFDFKQVLNMSKDNPVFYVQYAHARCSSIIEKSTSSNYQNLNDNDIDRCIKLLESISERKIIKNFEPHRIVAFLIELSSLFHSLQNEGKINPKLKFINEDKDLTYARLLIVESTKNIIFLGLSILGIDAVKKM